MTPNKPVFIFLTIFMISALILFVGCREPKLSSISRDREIHIDGKSDEWLDFDQYYDEDTRTLVGMLNDESHLYVLLSINDPMIKRQVMGFGLTVWFDPNGGKEKTFGIRFPVGMPRHMSSSFRGGPSGEDSDPLKKMLENPKTELQLLGPDEHEQRTMLRSDVMSYGIEVDVGRTTGNLVYELKIPLTHNGQVRYAVRTDMAKRIGVGFETGKPDQEEMKERSGKRGGGGKGGGRGGMGRGAPGGMGGGGRSEGMAGKHGGKKPEPLELWTKIQLSKN